MVDGLTDLFASMTDPANLMSLASLVPWTPDDPSITRSVLDQWSTSPALGPEAVAVLVDTDGSTLAASPPNATLPVSATTGGDHWDRVLAGDPAIPPLIDDGDHLRFYWVLPVLAEGRVERVLVVGTAVEQNNWSETLEHIGSLGPHPGGAVVLDEDGVVVSSWDPDQIGEIGLAGSSSPLTLDRRGELAVELDDEEWIVLTSPIPDPHSNRTVLWCEPRSELFSDLRAGQGLPDTAMMGSIAVALVVLSFVHHRREQQLRSHQARLDALLQQSSTIVSIVDSGGRHRFMGSGVTRYSGAPAHDYEGRTVASLVGTEGFAEVLTAIEAAQRGGGDGRSTVTATGQDGVTRTWDISVSDLRHHRAVDGYLVTARDRTERQQLEDELLARATHDPLTGLINRSELARRVEDLSTDRRASGQEHAIVFIDLDHFKPINDLHGHHVGDLVLREISRRLKSVIRSEDWVARHGGDEFTVVLRNCDRAHAEATADRLLAAVRAPVEVDGLHLQVDASAGVALGDVTGGQVGQLMRAADHAMYQAKYDGRSRWALAPASSL